MKIRKGGIQIMMAGVFAVYTIALLTLIGGERRATIAFSLVGLALCWILLWYHATSVLEINW